ncbi:MAG: Rrf2 family transcriptional regulator [Patescibacteria group bacterium]
MRLSRKSQYGLRAMICLARERKTVSINEISKAEKIPFPFLEKIMGLLRNANIVKAIKGARGGYLLAKKPNKISIGEIVRTIEKGISIAPCLGDIGSLKNICKRKNRCLAREAWKKLQDSLQNTLDSMTLDNLID